MAKLTTKFFFLLTFASVEAKQDMNLDQKLSALYAADRDKEFASFVEKIVKMHPVCQSLQPVADRYENALDDVMVTFSVQPGKELEELHLVALAAANDEIKSGKWNNLSSDESAAASMIAHQAYRDLCDGGKDVNSFMDVEMTLGVLTFAAVSANQCFNEYSFRRIFLEAWFVYFGAR